MIKQASSLEKDRLLVYANNHRASIYFQAGIAGFFLLFKHSISMKPAGGVTGWLVEIAALAICPYVLLRQLQLYRRILEAGERLKASDCKDFIVEIALNRIAYLLPWLAMLFWPLEARVYDHSPGYFFVFFAVAAYASASAAMASLFTIDVGIPVVFALCVSFLNWHVPATQGAALAVAVLCVYAVIISSTIRQSTLQLITTKYQLKKAARVAAEANKAKSSFLALMSHEIRTPMTGIFGMIDFLKQTGLTAEQRSFINTISDCSKTLLNTLNDILDFSKVESGKLTISKINYDFHGVLQNSARILRPIAEDKGLALNLEIAPDVPQTVYGDPHRVQQITLNLLNNAVKFTGKGSVSLKAFYVEDAAPENDNEAAAAGRMAAQAAGNDKPPGEDNKPAAGPRLRVEVTDTGIGISKENIGKLFSAFSQADGSISRKYGGTGLGLSIAKSLVGLMGGRIDVSSEDGKGSTFWFEVLCEAPVIAEEEEALEGAAETPAGPFSILVAEDNLINEQIITRVLTQKGHKVTNVRNGQAALQAVKVHPYDVIFMDVNMPGMNGIEATLEIRALGPRLRSIPIIGLTANVMEDYVRKCYDAGMVAHIGKPFEPATIHTTLAKIMRAAKAAGTETSKAAGTESANAGGKETGKESGTQTTAAAPPVAPVKGAYGVVGQKKVLAGSPRTMRDVLLALRDELGLEYLQQTVVNDLEEVLVLLENVRQGLKEQDFEALGHAAHDLKSVSGLIGMQKTSALAAGIEAACLKGEYAGLAESLPPLEQAAQAESLEADEMAKTMPES